MCSFDGCLIFRVGFSYRHCIFSRRVYSDTVLRYGIGSNTQNLHTYCHIPKGVSFVY